MIKDRNLIKKQIISGVLIGLLINALILVISLAAPPTSPYQPGETLDPNCSPGDPNCTVLPAITSLNGLTTTTQTFLVGTASNDFNIVSTGSIHIFNLPDASTFSRGLVSTGTQTFAGDKTFIGNLSISGNNNLFFVNKGKRESPQGGPYDWYRGFVYLGKDLTPDEWQTSTMDPVYNSAYLVLGVDTDIGAFMPAIYNPNDLSYLRAANIEGASGVFQGDIYLQKTEGSSIFFKPGGSSIESEIKYDNLNKKLFLIGYNGNFSFQIKTEIPIVNEIFSIYNSSTPLLSLSPSGDLTVNGFIIATSGIACNDPDAGCGWYFRNKDITDWYLKYDGYGGPSLNLSLGNINNPNYSFKIGFDNGTNFVPGIIFSNSGDIKLNSPWSNIYGENLKIWGNSNSNLLLQPPDSSSGNVGIGTTAPSEKLDVVGNIKASGSLTLSSLTPGSVLFAGTGGLISQDNANLYWDNINKRLGIGTTNPAGILHVTTGTTNALVIDNSGNVGIGTTTPAYKLHVIGSIAQTNALNCSLSADANGQIICTVSSLKYKENIQDLVFDKEKFLSLQPRTFEFKKDLPFKIEGKQVGFVAEEVATTFPELVRYNQNNEPEGIKYENISVYLYSIVKDLIKNFVSYVKDALTQLGIIIENGIVKIEKMFVKEVVIDFAEIKEAKINKATINQLCLEDESGTVCINKQDLKNILERNGIIYNQGGGGQSTSQNNLTTFSNTNEGQASSGNQENNFSTNSIDQSSSSNINSNQQDSDSQIQNSSNSQSDSSNQSQNSTNNQSDSLQNQPSDNQNSSASQESNQEQSSQNSANQQPSNEIQQ